MDLPTGCQSVQSDLLGRSGCQAFRLAETGEIQVPVVSIKYLTGREPLSVPCKKHHSLGSFSECIRNMRIGETLCSNPIRTPPVLLFLRAGFAQISACSSMVCRS
jgi:hypothetical protein